MISPLHRGLSPLGLGHIVAAAGSDADVDAYEANVIANGGAISATVLGYIATLVAGLKADGLWDKIQELYPFCGDNLAAARTKLKYVTATSLLANSGSFVSGDYAETGSTGGLKGNGSSKYLDSGFNPVSQSSSTSSFHLGAYVGATEGSGTSRVIMGGNSGVDNTWTFLGWLQGGTKDVGCIAAKMDQTEYTPTPGTTAKQGLLLATCNGDRSQKFYDDGSEVATAVTSSGSFGSANIWVGCRNNNGAGTSFMSARYLRLVTIGLGLSATDAANLSTRITTFQTSLSRNV